MSCACKCDRCGKFYERTEEFNNRKHKLCELRNSLELDLCKECYSELEEWFRCIQVRDCLHCKHSKNGKINSTETCHECMWENQFEKAEIGELPNCAKCDNYGTRECYECRRGSLFIKEDDTENWVSKLFKD